MSKKTSKNSSKNASRNKDSNSKETSEEEEGQSSEDNTSDNPSNSNIASPKDPHRFLRPTPLNAPTFTEDEPPSLELHGGWLDPIEHYEKLKIPDSPKDSSNEKTSFSKLTPDCADVYETLRVPPSPPYYEIERRRNLRCCRCCMCCYCIGRNFHQRTIQSPPEVNEEVPHTRNDNLALFATTRPSKTKKRSKQRVAQNDFNDAIEMRDRKDVDLASIYVNKASVGFQRGVSETKSKSKKPRERSRSRGK